jgi:hypothetical protein
MKTRFNPMDGKAGNAGKEWTMALDVEKGS